MPTSHFQMSRLIGVILVLLVTLWAALASGQISIYLDIPTLIWMTITPIGALLFSFGLKGMIQAFACLISEVEHQYSIQQYRQAVFFFARANQIVWGAAMVSTLLAIIAIFSDITDPGSFGSVISMCLLSLLYAAFVAELIISPLHQIAQNKWLICKAKQQPKTEDQNEHMTDASLSTEDAIVSSPNGMARSATLLAIILLIMLVGLMRYPG